MSLSKLLLTSLPAWARPDDPVLRYVLRDAVGPHVWTRRAIRWLIGLAVVTVVVFASVVYQALKSAYGSSPPAPQPDLYDVLYSPLLIGQIGVLLVGLLIVSNTIGIEQGRGTWEDLKITSHGAEKLVRARWAALFYQMRGLLALLLIARLVLVVQMLIDLTDYQGYHLDLYLTGITPDVPVAGGVILLAALMTAALLQVPVLLGLNTALGLWVATVFQRRGTALLARIGLVVSELTAFGAALAGGRLVLESNLAALNVPHMSMAERWVRLFALGALGDQNLRFMRLDTFLQTWTDVDYGVLLGGALLIAVLVEIALTNALLAWAARRAARPVQG